MWQYAHEYEFIRSPYLIKNPPPQYNCDRGPLTYPQDGSTLLPRQNGGAASFMFGSSGATRDHRLSYFKDTFFTFPLSSELLVHQLFGKMGTFEPSFGNGLDKCL
mgnify:FL=1